MPARRWFHSICILVGLLTVSLVVLWIAPARVLAQCEIPQPSSCTTCHQSQDPVADKGEWHSIHASKDICINCHGGNGTAMDKDAAHLGMVAKPLSDVYTDCHSCHPDDYQARAGEFAATLQVTPGSCVTPTAVVAANMGGRPPAVNAAMPIQTAGLAASAPPYALMAVVLLAFILFCAGLRWLDAHRLER